LRKQLESTGLYHRQADLDAAITGTYAAALSKVRGTLQSSTYQRLHGEIVELIPQQVVAGILSIESFSKYGIGPGAKYRYSVALLLESKGKTYVIENMSSGGSNLRQHPSNETIGGCASKLEGFGWPQTFDGLYVFEFGQGDVVLLTLYYQGYRRLAMAQNLGPLTVPSRVKHSDKFTEYQLFFEAVNLIQKARNSKRNSMSEEGI
ncbi:MAG: hypothetical protein SVM79_07125, partial [Chloroflexota bacterium]|nr:hypothetical protein [Chloroflexota bacterium]